MIRALFTLLVLGCAMPASAALFGPRHKNAPAPRATDPLAPLTAEEISAAAALVRESGVFASSSTFALITLREPEKGEAARGRQAQLIVVDDSRRETSQAVVDLKERKLAAWRLLFGVSATRAPFARPTYASPAPKEEKNEKATPPEFTVDGSRVRWEKWNLRAVLHPREGLVLYDAAYEGRSVLARASVSEIARLASDETGTTALTLVESSENFGRLARPLEPRVDAPSDAVFLDAAFADDAGVPFVVPRAAAVFTRRNLKSGRELVARMSSKAGGREYAQVWIFRQSGEIEARVEVSGSTTAAESHFFNYRLDLDVDGSTTSVVELGLTPASGKPLKAEPLALRTSLEARRDAAPALARRWLAASATGKNGWALVPAEGSPAPSVDVKKASYLSKSFWALPYRPDRVYAAGEFPAAAKPDDLERWAREDEPLDDRDLVFWHAFGATTLPAPGHRASAGFRLTPQ